MRQCRQPLTTMAIRSLSVAMPETITRSSIISQEDVIKATIQKMMQHESPASVTHEALHKASYSLQVCLFVYC